MDKKKLNFILNQKKCDSNYWQEQLKRKKKGKPNC